jgi:hypothetical protein
LHDRCEVCCPGVCSILAHGNGDRSLLVCRARTAIAIELYAAALRSCQRCLRASADHVALFIRDQGHDADSETVRARHVDGYEIIVLNVSLDATWP